jgi:hypothetical protein
VAKPIQLAQMLAPSPKTTPTPYSETNGYPPVVAESIQFNALKLKKLNKILKKDDR